MRQEKTAAIKLRLGGKSYSEIQKLLGIPKSTLSGWLSRIILSEKLQKGIENRTHEKSIAGLLRHNKNQTTLARKRAMATQKHASAQIGNLSKRELFIAGITLYWAEGYKRQKLHLGKPITNHPVSITNSDPYLIKLFLRFLREYCEVPERKIKASIRIYEHMNEHELKRFWQKETAIVPENFKKTYYGISKSSMHKRPFNRLPYGVIQVTVADTPLYHAIMGYIEGIKKIV